MCGGIDGDSGPADSVVDELCAQGGLAIGPHGDQPEFEHTEDLLDATLRGFRRTELCHHVAPILRDGIVLKSLIERVGETSMPTRFGEFRAIGYRTFIDSKEHVALVMGTLRSDAPALVRVHDRCVTGDVFGSMRCDCGDQKDAALQRIAGEGRGVFLYMDQEGRGIGLHNKLRAYRLQEDQGLDTYEANEALGLPADAREYGISVQILIDLGIRQMRLMTNNPVKIREINAFGALYAAGLHGLGLSVVEREPLEIIANPHSVRYLTAKRDKTGHMFEQSMPEIARVEHGSMH